MKTSRARAFVGIIYLATIACATTALSADATDDCILHLDFDKIVDNGFVCRASGSRCRVDGRALVQQGALRSTPYQAVFVPEVASLTGREQLTLSAWVAPVKTPQSYETILYRGKRRGPAIQQVHFSLCLFSGRPELKFKDESGKWQGIMRNGDAFSVPGQKSVPLSQVPRVRPRRWSHVAATFDRGEVVLFLNGEAILSARCPVDHLVPSSEPLMIGEAQSLAGPRAYYFPGLIDDVRVHNRALTHDKVARMYRDDRQRRPERELKIAPIMPPGYDPGFKTKLPLVEAYKQRVGELATRPKPVTSAVRPFRGAPTLHVDGRPVYAMAMMPEPYVSNELITHSCRDFAAAGVDLYSEIFWSWMTPGDGCSGWWLGPGRYDFDKIDRRIGAIVKANPRALIFPRIKLNPPTWWLKAHPDEVARLADGTSGKQASLASELWEETYERMLRDVVRHMETSDYAGHIVGYHPAGGRASEWFWWGKNGHMDYCPSAQRRFRKWLSERNRGDVAALRRAWGNDAVTFDSAKPPTLEFRQTTEHLFFRHPRRAAAIIDYRRFLSEMTSRNIVRSCRIVKEETGGKKFAGVFYGYSTYCVSQTGFRGLRRVLDSPHVDFLCSPTAYDRRRGKDAGTYVSAYTASYRLHNKLYWDEVDTRTHLCPTLVHYRTATLPETQSVLERAFGYTLTKGTGLWWFLLAGNATFHQAEVMDAVTTMKRAGDAAMGSDLTPTSEVAVFADEPSMLYANTNFPLRRALLRDTIDELACMGAPSDMYLLSDIGHPRLPDYKLYVFLNAFKVDEPTRQVIHARVRTENRTAVWVYAPGYITDDGFDEKSMQALTGISLRAHEESVNASLSLTDAKHAITAEAPRQAERPFPVGPVFSVEDPEATILARTGARASLAVREFPAWRSVYSMLPLSREIFLGLCRYAGVHVYSETFDPFAANKSFVMIHTAAAGTKRIVLPGAHDVSDVLSGRTVAIDARVIEERLPAGVTRSYRIEPPK